MSAFPPSSLQPILNEVTSLLKERNETVAVAETAAGGLISASLLTVPGASKYYKGGLTLYTLPSRIAFANWTPSHIQSYAGPTPALVAELAENTRANLTKADKDSGKGSGPTWVIAESGTAGPTRSGEGRNRTPGYVAVAVAGPEGCVMREVETGGNERGENMVRFAESGLGLLRDAIKGTVVPEGKL